MSRKQRGVRDTDAGAAGCRPRSGNFNLKTCRSGLEHEFADPGDLIAAVARSLEDTRGGILTVADRAVLAARTERFEARLAAPLPAAASPDGRAA